jgi:hypothetical protein
MAFSPQITIGEGIIGYFIGNIFVLSLCVCMWIFFHRLLDELQQVLPIIG